MTPALATVYRCVPIPGVSPQTDEVEMIDPLRCAFIIGEACLIPKNTALSSTSIVRSYSSAVVVSSGPVAPTKPALL